jgi:hypothetical protein
MFETASNFVAAIEDLLRYVAPGFVAVALFLVTFPSFTLPGNLTIIGAPYLVFGSGILAGVILNSCHVAILEDVFCWLVVWSYNTFAPTFTKKIPTSSTSLMMQVLERRREFRRSSSNERARQFQRRHDRFGASLTFLYCASYPGLIIVFYQALTSRPVSRMALITGLSFLFFAVACDATYTRRDIWAATEKRLKEDRHISNAAQQIGRERRERVSHLDSSGDA